MTQKEKDLLLKDLCARLPYNPLVKYEGEDYNVLGIAHGRLVLCKPLMSHTLNENPRIEEVKPYLFSLKSMTDEQKKEFDQFLEQLLELELKAISDEIDQAQATAFEIDFYNKHHFDWRGLIPMGLALNATGLNIY